MKKIFPLLFLLMAQLGITQDFSNSPWHIEASSINPNDYYGVTVANGMIGIVSSPRPMQIQDVVLNGVYDYYQRGRVSNILKTFNPLDMTLTVNNIRVSDQNTSGYKQVLDMKRAVLTTTFDIGDEATVKHEIMALRHLPYTAMIQVEITAKKPVNFDVESVIVAPDHLTDVRNYYSEIVRPHVNVPLLTSVGKSPSGKHRLAVSNSFLFPEPHGEQPKVTHIDWDYNRHWAMFSNQIKAGETYRFAVVSSAVSTEHYEDPHNEAERLTIFAALEGQERLYQKHQAAWEELWQSDIIVEGDVDVQRDVHSAIYHLYSFAREGTAYSLSPMGLSGLGYNGHIFWDTELWMYPPLLLLQPEIAHSLLEYRFERLGAAQQNAFAHGFKGAMFPWESSSEGSEDTPVWALTGPFQHHITGCIGWSFWKYYQVTGDKEWLRERGYPMLKEVADFWTSRVERNGPGQYDIKNVIGANEWEENIDNNAFTNGMARTVLQFATQAANELGLKADPDWMHVAQNIPLLQFPDGTTRENATYNGVDIKQADVNLLAYPLKVISQEADIIKDLKYYEQRMSDEGPAMGPAILSVLYSRLGNPAKAKELFTKSYLPNKVPPFDVLAETAGGTNPYFATGAGGMLQAMLSGFGGLDITKDGIVQLKTQLPDGWKSLELKGIGIDNKTYRVE